jgi:hypothetical protein
VVDALLAMLVVAGLTAFTAATLLGVTVAPFLVALDHADRRRASPTRVGAAAALGSVAGLGLAATAMTRSEVPTAVAVLPVLLSWLVPVVVARAPARGLGRAGRHERVPG